MWPLRRKAQVGSAPEESTTPNIILAGAGVHDRLELTVETQRLLSRYGRTFTLGLPPSLRPLLKSMRVEVEELDTLFEKGRPFASVYLDVVAAVLERAAAERPVILLTQGNPLFMNAISRTLAMEGKRLGLTVQVLPAVSLVDVLINDMGIDVSVHGLQVFDASWLVGRALSVSTDVPLLVLNIAGYRLETVPEENQAPDYESFIQYLCRFYGPSHVVTVVQAGATGGFSFGPLRLDALASEAKLLSTATCLYLDAVEAQHGAAAE